MSKETHHFLEEYTNNYCFAKTYVFMKGIGQEPIYAVSLLEGRKRRKGSRIISKQAKKMAKMLEFEDDSDNASAGSEAMETGRQLVEQELEADEEEANSNREGEKSSMNVFNFNDDLNLDDRQIVKNMTENETFKLVERP